MLSQQFERYTTQYIQQYSNCVPQSKAQLNEMILACTKQQKSRIWMSIGKYMEMTTIQVHDYFYNTWQLQFYDDASFGKAEFKQLFVQFYDRTLSVSANIKITIEKFK